MPKLKILIAEDDKVVQKIFELGLPKTFFEYRITGNGAEAVSLYESFKPDVVLLDILMPEKNGFQVLEVIRKGHGDDKTTVIMVTSVAEKEHVVACVKLGIQGYIIKPFKTNEIAEIIYKHHPGVREKE